MDPKYVFLGPPETFPVNITSDQEGRPEIVLQDSRETLRLTIEDMKHISPIICMPQMHLEDEPPDYNLEKAIELFQDHDGLEIRKFMTSLSRDTQNSKFGGSDRQVSPVEVPNLGIEHSVPEVLPESLPTPQPDPPDIVREEIQELETHSSDESVCQDTHMKPKWAPQKNPVVLQETFDEDVFYLFIFLIWCSFLIMVAVLFDFVDPQLFRLLIYDLKR